MIITLNVYVKICRRFLFQNSPWNWTALCWEPLYTMRPAFSSAAPCAEKGMDSPRARRGPRGEPSCPFPSTWAGSGGPGVRACPAWEWAWAGGGQLGYPLACRSWPQAPRALWDCLWRGPEKKCEDAISGPSLQLSRRTLCTPKSPLVPFIVHPCSHP